LLLNTDPMEAIQVCRQPCTPPKSKADPSVFIRPASKLCDSRLGALSINEIVQWVKCSNGLRSRGSATLYRAQPSA
jgi:hypothetical protein